MRVFQVTNMNPRAPNARVVSMCECVQRSLIPKAHTEYITVHDIKYSTYSGTPFNLILRYFEAFSTETPVFSRVCEFKMFSLSKM